MDLLLWEALTGSQAPLLLPEAIQNILDFCNPKCPSTPIQNVLLQQSKNALLQKSKMFFFSNPKCPSTAVQNDLLQKSKTLICSRPKYSFSAIQNVLLLESRMSFCSKCVRAGVGSCLFLFADLVSANGKWMPSPSREMHIQILSSRKLLLFLQFLTRSSLEKLEEK